MIATDRTFSSLTVGETCVREHHIDQQLVDSFVALSGDENPLHTDKEYAATTIFKNRIVHGMLLATFVSELIGMHIPGKRCLLVKEVLEFKLPVYIEDTISVEGTVASKSDATKILQIDIAIKRNKEVVAGGVVHVKVI